PRVQRDAAVVHRAEMRERTEREPDLRDLRQHAAVRRRRPAVRAFEPAYAEARTEERGGVRPDRVHVLVDPDLLLGRLIGVLRTSPEAACSLVQPRDDGAG